MTSGRRLLTGPLCNCQLPQLEAAFHSLTLVKPLPFQKGVTLSPISNCCLFLPALKSSMELWKAFHRWPPLPNGCPKSFLRFSPILLLSYQNRNDFLFHSDEYESAPQLEKRHFTQSTINGLIRRTKKGFN